MKDVMAPACAPVQAAEGNRNPQISRDTAEALKLNALVQDLQKRNAELEEQALFSVFLNEKLEAKEQEVNEMAVELARLTETLGNCQVVTQTKAANIHMRTIDTQFKLASDDTQKQELERELLTLREKIAELEMKNRLLEQERAIEIQGVRELVDAYQRLQVHHTQFQQTEAGIKEPSVHAKAL